MKEAAKLQKAMDTEMVVPNLLEGWWATISWRNFINAARVSDLIICKNAYKYNTKSIETAIWKESIRKQMLTLCSKMMSNAVDVASSTSYTARAIFLKPNNTKVNINILGNYIFNLNSEDSILEDLSWVWNIWLKMLILILLIFQLVWAAIRRTI